MVDVQSRHRRWQLPLCSSWNKMQRKNKCTAELNSADVGLMQVSFDIVPLKSNMDQLKSCVGWLGILNAELHGATKLIIPPATKLEGVYWIHPVCLSVCPSVCPLTFLVRPVASTVQDGLFPYLVQKINSMRGCVACDDPWPWPISSRSLGLDLENCVRSAVSPVLDGFFFIFCTNDHYH